MPALLLLVLAKIIKVVLTLASSIFLILLVVFLLIALVSLFFADDCTAIAVVGIGSFVTMVICAIVLFVCGIVFEGDALNWRDEMVKEYRYELAVQGEGTVIFENEGDLLFSIKVDGVSVPKTELASEVELRKSVGLATAYVEWEKVPDFSNWWNSRSFSKNMVIYYSDESQIKRLG